MDILKWFRNVFMTGKQGTSNIYPIYVTCNRCGEEIEGRVNLYSDLSIIYEGSKQTYFCRKVVIGESHCFQQIEVQLTFNEKRHLIDRQISGGKFIER